MLAFMQVKPLEGYAPLPTYSPGVLSAKVSAFRSHLGKSSSEKGCFGCVRSLAQLKAESRGFVSFVSVKITSVILTPSPDRSGASSV